MTLTNIPPRSPPSFNQLNGAHVKPVASEHLSKDQSPPLVGGCGIEMVEHFGERVQGSVVGHTFQFGIRIGQVCRPQTGLARQVKVDGVEPAFPHQDGLQYGLHRRHAGRHSLRIGQPTTLKMGAERFSKDVEPIHLRIRVNAEISIATHVRIRGQPGQPNGGVRVIGHRFIKKCNQPKGWLHGWVRWR